MHGRKPADYQPPPPMDEVVEYYVRAFFKMSRSRPYHFGGAPGYLSLSSIADYTAVFGDPYDVDEFIDIIYAMDAEYLPVAIRKQKAENMKQANSQASGRQPLTPPVRGR